MKLPNAYLATVSPRKVRGYLLSSTHPRGKSKAAFFRNLGFPAEEPQWLIAELRRHAAENKVFQSTETDFGSRYVVDGWIISPVGATAPVRAVWFVDTGQEIPRFVTAHPLRRRS
jgi:hypothetical protein